MPTVNIPVDLNFNLYETLGLGIFSAIYRAGSDFLAGENKAWYYYLGAFSGATVVATGIPGAAIAVDVVANYVDFQIQKNPNAGELKIFVDGVQQGVVDCVAVTAVWDTIRVQLFPDEDAILNSAVRRISLQMDANDAATWSWFALGGASAFRFNDNPIIEERVRPAMAYNILAFRIRDAESDTREATVPVYVPTGKTLAEYQAYADAVAPEIDALTEGQITGIDLTVSLALVGGLKASPVAKALNERGGLITFDTTGPRADSVRIPAMDTTIMTGDSFSLSDTDVAALITRLTTSTTGGLIQPRTSQDYEYSAARKGAKSFRKQ